MSRERCHRVFLDVLTPEPWSCTMCEDRCWDVAVKVPSWGVSSSFLAALQKGQ